MNKQYNTRAILASLLMCGFVGMFSETALNIAMTNLMEVFQISAATAQWLTTGFLLTLGILMPMSGLLLPEVYNETAVHRFAHKLNSRYTHCGARV